MTQPTCPFYIERNGMVAPRCLLGHNDGGLYLVCEGRPVLCGIMRARWREEEGCKCKGEDCHGR